MSAPGPSSIPTSADPRSRRPTKKRALSPTSAHAASLTALFAKPDQEIAIPSSSQQPRRPRHLPPEIVSNVQGSSAGAGSGEFHVYKASRRREYERLRQMDEDLKQDQQQEAFEKSRAEKLKRDEERTRKNRERRDKIKARKAKGGKNGNGNDHGHGPTETQNPHRDTHSQGTRPDEHPSGQPVDGAATTDDGHGRPGRTRHAEEELSVAPAVGLVIHDDD
ncbi:hypothetical protein E4U43_003064 [Claviceps pusilla]|uniref:DUF1168 domain protein n=1 Tax=Claviceps pusilla TaxID=123648 RepID=A0A9P7SXV5_9HYPO|nr:hypothetical protein E4U43_003064 [Claviceps pusilla]